MSQFIITFWAVVVMLAYACPGYILVKTKKLKEESIPNLVTLLLFICQPCLTVYSFQQATRMIHSGAFTVAELGVRGIIFFALTTAFHALSVGLFYLIFRRKQQRVPYRIFVIATTFSNCGFFGVPILSAIMPDHPEVAMYSAICSLVMNALAWTIGSAIITRDKKYISWRKIVFNPNTLSAVVAIPLFCFNILLPDRVDSMVTLLAQFSTPLCMIILGMRLATVPVRSLLSDHLPQWIVLVKNLASPLLAFALAYFLPVDGYIKQVLFVLCCCPVANVVLSFAEMLNEGQKTAANAVLLSTIFSLISLPVMCLLLPFLA